MSARSPVIVSFYTKDPYYREAAECLRQDCVSLSLDSDIVALDTIESETWLDVCRRKVSFYLEMHRKHRRPILWLDVDSRIGRRPDILDGAPCDFAAFLRGFRYLRDFDPVSSPRFFAPFALYFNATARVTAFLDLMAELEAGHRGSATDDFFLQEAWLRHQAQLSVMVLPPDLLGDAWPLGERETFYVGRSGSVSKFRKQAEQHSAALFAPAHRQRVLVHEAELAIKAGEVEQALALYRRALAALPDEALAAKVGRLTRRHGSRSEADDPLNPLDQANPEAAGPDR